MRWLVLCSAMLVGACASLGESDVATQYAAANTQVSLARSTVTIEAARIQTTLEFAQTQVGLAATQSQFLKATLVGRGTPLAALEAYQDSYRASRAVPTLALAPAVAGTPQVVNTPLGEAGEATRIPITPQALPTIPLVLPPSNDIRLDEVVTSLSVGADDCADNVTTIFLPTAPRIYVVARAYGLTEGATVTSRWLKRGEEVIRYDFIPSFNVSDGACIWFYIDPSDVAFEVADWGVELLVNGNPATDPIPFSILGG